LPAGVKSNINLEKIVENCFDWREVDGNRNAQFTGSKEVNRKASQYLYFTGRLQVHTHQRVTQGMHASPWETLMK